MQQRLTVLFLLMLAFEPAFPSAIAKPARYPWLMMADTATCVPRAKEWTDLEGCGCTSYASQICSQPLSDDEKTEIAKYGRFGKNAAAICCECGGGFSNTDACAAALQTQTIEKLPIGAELGDCVISTSTTSCQVTRCKKVGSKLYRASGEGVLTCDASAAAKKLTFDVGTFACDECTNLPGWLDSEGRSCDEYDRYGYCTPTGALGPNWPFPKLGFGHYATKRIDAAVACCACGGGALASGTTATIDPDTDVRNFDGGEKGNKFEVILAPFWLAGDGDMASSAKSLVQMFFYITSWLAVIVFGHFVMNHDDKAGVVGYSAIGMSLLYVLSTAAMTQTVTCQTVKRMGWGFAWVGALMYLSGVLALVRARLHSGSLEVRPLVHQTSSEPTQQTLLQLEENNSKKEDLSPTASEYIESTGQSPVGMRSGFFDVVPISVNETPKDDSNKKTDEDGEVQEEAQKEPDTTEEPSKSSDEENVQQKPAKEEEPAKNDANDAFQKAVMDAGAQAATEVQQQLDKSAKTMNVVAEKFKEILEDDFVKQPSMGIVIAGLGLMAIGAISFFGGCMVPDVPYNLAFGRSCKQSSTFEKFSCDLANHGPTLLNNQRTNKVCSRTTEEGVPFWKVDLGADFEIGTIHVRAGCPDVVTSPLQIILSSEIEDSVSRVRCGSPIDADGQYHSIDCHKTTARYVSIRPKTDSKEVLCVCDVQVLGRPVSDETIPTKPTLPPRGWSC